MFIFKQTSAIVISIGKEAISTVKLDKGLSQLGISLMYLDTFGNCLVGTCADSTKWGWGHTNNICSMYMDMTMLKGCLQVCL